MMDEEDTENKAEEISLPAINGASQQSQNREEEEEDIKIENDQVLDTIKVLVRIRPIISLEIENADHRDVEAIIEADKGKEVVIKGSEARHKLRCTFDQVLGPESTQCDVYNHVSECAKQVARGYNATILAYGQTGSGKSHTMFGPLGWHEAPENCGLIPRAVKELFDTFHGSNTIVYASFVQIYREQIFDMLRDPHLNAPLEIHSANNNQEEDEVFVSGLSEYAVRSADDCATLIRSGEQNRAVRETHMNDASSRSHSIFSLLVEQRRVQDGTESTLRSKFNLVDLAGSEKWDTTRVMHDAHVAEMTKINLSLHTLGKCVAALSKASKQKRKGFTHHIHVPYRESKLTRLLQDSLGGNSITRLIATLSPARDCVEESISTLRFADRARSVIVTVRRNEQRPVDFAMVQRLQKEVVRLRAMIKAITLEASSTTQGKSLDIGKLLNELERLKAENEVLRHNPEEKQALFNTSMQNNMTTSSSIVSSLHSTNKPMSEINNRLERALKRNQVLEKALHSVDSAAKKFFAFDIEEDGLRCQIEQAVALATSTELPLEERQMPQTIEASRKPHLPPTRVPKHEPPLCPREETKVPKFRVRTLGSSSTNRNSNWIDPQIERHEALRRELKDTKARMKRHAQLREWLKRKSEQEAEIEQKEHDAREAEMAAAAARDDKFKRRAHKQKQKLQHYYQQLTSSLDPSKEISSSPTHESKNQQQYHNHLSMLESLDCAYNKSPLESHSFIDERDNNAVRTEKSPVSPVDNNNNNNNEEDDHHNISHRPETDTDYDVSSALYNNHSMAEATAISANSDVATAVVSSPQLTQATLTLPIQKQQPDIRFF